VSVVLPGRDRVGHGEGGQPPRRPPARRPFAKSRDRHRALRRDAELLAPEQAELRVGLDPLVRDAHVAQCWVGDWHEVANLHLLDRMV